MGQATTIYIKDTAMLAEARRLRLNVSRVCEDAIKAAVEQQDEIHDLIWGPPVTA